MDVMSKIQLNYILKTITHNPNQSFIFNRLEPKEYFIINNNIGEREITKRNGSPF